MKNESNCNQKCSSWLSLFHSFLPNRHKEKHPLLVPSDVHHLAVLVRKLNNNMMIGLHEIHGERKEGGTGFLFLFLFFFLFLFLFLILYFFFLSNSFIENSEYYFVFESVCMHWQARKKRTEG